MKLNQTLALAALIVGSVFAGSNLMQAQDATTNPPPATVKPGSKNLRGLDINFLAKQLNLTDAQKPKVKAAIEEQQQKQRELHSDTTLSMDEKKAKLITIRQGLDAKLKEILTPDQYAKLKKSGTGVRRPIPAAAPVTAPATNAAATAK